MPKITVRLIGALGVACQCAAVTGESEDTVVDRLQGAADDRKMERALQMSLRIV